MKQCGDYYLLQKFMANQSNGAGQNKTLQFKNLLEKVPENDPKNKKMNKRELIQYDYKINICIQ